MTRAAANSLAPKSVAPNLTNIANVCTGYSRTFSASSGMCAFCRLADMLSAGIDVCYVPQADIVGDLTNAAAHDDPEDRAVSFPLSENRATLCRQRGPALLNDMHEIPSCGI